MPRYGPIARLLGPTQPSAKQPPFALAGHKVDIADESCSALASCQHDFAAVKILKLGSMRDANQSRARQLLDERLHHLVLAVCVECRSRLVKHNDVRVVQEQTRKSEAPDDFVSELASDDCASELSLALEFLADDFALPIT